MQFLSRNRTRVNCKIGAASGKCEQAAGSGAGSILPRQSLVQQFTNKCVDGRVVLRSMDLGLTDKIGWKAQCNISIFHWFQCITQLCVSVLLPAVIVNRLPFIVVLWVH